VKRYIPVYVNCLNLWINRLWIKRALGALEVKAAHIHDLTDIIKSSRLAIPDEVVDEIEPETRRQQQLQQIRLDGRELQY